MSPLVIRTLPADHITPVRAYAALRAQSPGRSSYLFESAVPGDRWGRYALLGYRAHSESMYPSGYDPFDMLAQDLAQPEDVEGLAANLAQAMVGFICYDAVHVLHDIDPWPNESCLARMMKGATVAVFDRVAQTVTIAGASQGAVNRCAWEMTHGPEVPWLPTPDPEALPDALEIPMSDEACAIRVMRAKERLAAGEAKEVVLARAFRAPLRGVDPFDVYRALRLLTPSQHLFFLDFAESAFAPGLTVLGASPETLARIEREPTEGWSPVGALRAAFPAGGPLGAPKEQAIQLIRELEMGPRKVYGGAVGYFLPNGSVELSVGLQTLWLEQGYFEVTAGAPVTAESTPEAVAAATRRAAHPALSAVRAAYEALAAREAAAARKAEKAAAEKAAAEKAAAEKAAAEKAAAEKAAAEKAAAEKAAPEGSAAGDGESAAGDEKA